MYLEQQMAELIRVIEAGFNNLAEILRSQASPPATLAPMVEHAVDTVVETAKPALAVVPNGQDQTTQTTETGLTFDEVNAIAQEVARVKSPPVAIDLIRQHGASRLAELDKTKYPSFVAACEVLLGKSGEAAL